MPEALVAEGIGVRFGGVAALTGVDLALERGEAVGLIGANGAGKSTLVNVLTGFQRPTTGRVTLGGAPLDRLAPHRVARRGVARTFQAVRLFGDLTAEENVAAAGVAAGISRTRVAELLEWFGLAEMAERRAASLPYGHQRRLAIARALAVAPRFLLLDEPAAGMTPDEVEGLRHTLAEARERTGCGLLLVDHNMSLVMAAVERIVVLDGGRVIARGTPAEVRADPAVRRAYLGHREDLAA